MLVLLYYLPYSGPMVYCLLRAGTASPERRERMLGPDQGGYQVTTAEMLEAVGRGATIEKKAVTALGVLNEAYDYAKPSSFSRGLRIELGGIVILLISGTASVDENGASVHAGDFRAQCRRTFLNITGLLESEGVTWKDIVRTTCYLRDIDRDYEAFNEERTAFYGQQGLDPLPASTGIQAILCRPELLVEIEAIAMFRREPAA
jgi:2-iminobutanoate/2-iminopropanoate deaminase